MQLLREVHDIFSFTNGPSSLIFRGTSHLFFLEFYKLEFCQRDLSMRALLLCILLCCLNSVSQGQNLGEIKVDGLYLGSVTSVLDQISKKTGISFSFDRERFSKYNNDSRFFKQSITVFLDQLCQEYKMKYYQDSSGTVFIVDKFVLVDERVVTKAQPVKERIRSAETPIRTDFQFTGTVKDNVSGESLPFVNLQVVGTKVGVSTNVDGYFSMLKVPSDTCLILVTYLGYDPIEFRLTPQTKVKDVIVEMTQSAKNLEEVVVSSQKEQTVVALQSNEKISMIKMTPAKIANLPNVGERDIFRSFQLMPGVSGANENSAGLYVRGGTPDQVLVTYDGFTVYHVDHLFGFYSAFNYNALKEVQLYKGGFEAKFGGRVSSVSEITGKEGNQRQLNVGGDLSLLSMNAFLEAPLSSKLTFFVAARRSWRGPIYDKIFEIFNTTSSSTVNPPPTGGGPPRRNFLPSFGTTVTSYFYDINSKVTFKPTDKDIFSWSVYNGTDDMDNSRKLDAPNFFRGGNVSFNANITDLTIWGNTGSSLKWSRRWNDKFYSNTLVSISNYFSNRDRSNENTTTTTTGETQTVKTGTLENNDLYDYSFKFDSEYKVSENTSLEFGTMITKNDIRYTYSQNDTSAIIDRHVVGSTYSGYLQDRLRLFNNTLLVIPGIRMTLYDVTRKTYSEPRLSINYQLSGNITLKGSTGRYYQFAKRVIREDILQGSRDFWTLADGEKLPVSYADHFIAGASYETGTLLFDVEAYYKRLDGLSEYSLRFTPSFGQVNYNESFYQGSGKTLGIDFLVQKKTGAYTGWVGYTLSQTTNTFPAYQEKPYLASQNVTHEFKSINTYQVGRWNFSLTWLYATGKPYTAPEGSYAVTLLDGTTNAFMSVSTKNGLKLPDYHRMDAAITYHWTTKRGAMNSIGLSIFNLYNQQNIWYKDFQVVSGQLVETNVYYLGFTPNITVSWKLK